MTFQEASEPLLADLFYPSESDEPVEYISIESEKPLPFSEEDIRDFIEANELPISSIELPAFWEKLTTTKEWYMGEEILRVEKFTALKSAFETHLTHIQGFRVGEIEISIYVFGENASGKIEGIKTLAIES